MAVSDRSVGSGETGAEVANREVYAAQTHIMVAVYRP